MCGRNDEAVSDHVPTRPQTPGRPGRLPPPVYLSHPNIGVVSIAGLRTLNSLVPGAYTPETLPGLALTYIHLSPGHEVWVGPEDDPLTHCLRPMADTRLRLLSREGRVFVHGIIPRTPSLVLTEGDDRSPYPLLLIV